jgi:hypothetical protein
MLPRIALILSLAVPTYAGILYSTGFESPTFTTGDIAGQNGWEVFGNPTYAAQVESGVAESGTQAVVVYPAIATEQTGPYYAISTAAPIVEMSGYIYLASSSTQSEWQFAATGPSFGGFIGGVDIQNNGAIDLIGPGTDVGTITYNAWQLLDFVFNFNTQTYSFSLNGSLISSGVAFCGSNVGCSGANIASFGDLLFDTFPATDANDTGYLDNVTISSVSSTPEPGSLLLLGAGLAAVIARRVKR